MERSQHEIPAGGIHLPPPQPIPQRIQVGLEWQPTVGDMPVISGPVAFPLGNVVKIIGGSTQRLAVASNIIGHLLRASPTVEEAARAALDHADVLIAMELSDRLQSAAAPAQPIEPVENGKSLDISGEG